MRLRTVASLVLSLAAGGVQAAASDDPAAFVRAVYARYAANGPGVGMEPGAGKPFYSPVFLAAFAADRRQAGGEVGTIDADPLCACQDFDLTIGSIAVEASTADTAVVRAGLVNLGHRETVTLALVHTAEGWRIDDIGNRDAPSIRRRLAEAQRR